MKTLIVDHDELYAMWCNARWFTHYTMRWRKLSNGKYAVKTNYPWVESSKKVKEI